MTQTAEHPNLTRARDLCLSFLDSIEDDRDGHPTFRVREKAFASIVPGDDARFSLLMQAAAGEQDSLLAEGPPFFLPRRGPKGWIGIGIDDGTDWAEVEELVGDSYRAIAPKSVVRKHDGLR